MRPPGLTTPSVVRLPIMAVADFEREDEVLVLSVSQRLHGNVMGVMQPLRSLADVENHGRHSKT